MGLPTLFATRPRGFCRDVAQSGQALLTAVFPPRCAACDVALVRRTPVGLCCHCFEILEPNNGPHRCPVCDAPHEDGSLDGALCHRCHQQSPPFARLRAPWIYGGPLADLVAAAKFRHREDIARSLGHLIAFDPEVRDLASQGTALVAVPLGLARRLTRGFNQSAVMAHVLGEICGVPVVAALRRVRNTKPQSDLPVAERGANVEGAFVACRRLRGAVVLVDDVCTSTETARQAARALSRAGAGPVFVVAATRAEEGLPPRERRRLRAAH